MDEPFLNVVRCLNSRKVRYVVIGGNAAVHHGVPRTTLDLDILIEATLDNAERLLSALKDAHMGTASLTTPERIVANDITIFNDWTPVDVMTNTPGVRFETAWRNRTIQSISGVRVPWLGRKDLIRAKRAAGRPQDLEDVAVLTKAKIAGKKRTKRR